jgi:hypothetical protein
MLDLCTRCEGLCERTQIAVLLPGEETFIAEQLGITTKEFVERYCTVVLYREQHINMLKAGTCPFLNEEYRCTLERHNCKPITGLLYPVLIGISEDEIEIFVDHEHCPMAGEITEQFRKSAFSAFESIKHDIPRWWLEFVSEFDNCLYDYSKLEKFREQTHITTDELKSCMK